MLVSGIGLLSPLVPVTGGDMTRSSGRNLRCVMLAVVQFVGCLVGCAAALNLGQFVVWAAAAVVWAAAPAAVWAAVAAVEWATAAAVVWATATAVVWGATAVVWAAAAAVVWAALTACLGTAVAPVHVAV